MRIVLRLEMTITIDVEDDLHKHSSAEQVQTSAQCAQCGWTKLYPSDSSAKKGLAAHMRHCKKTAQMVKQTFERLVAS